MNYLKALEILGLEDDYDEEQLKRNYRILVKHYHPDLYSTGPIHERLIAEMKTKEINEAYEILFKRLRHEFVSQSEDSYDTVLEKTKTDMIDKLNVRLKNLNNFFDIEYLIYKSEEIKFVEEAISQIKKSTTDLEIFDIMRKLKMNIEQNNLESFRKIIASWQVDSLTNEALSEFYRQYKAKVKCARSIINTAELIEKLKQDCYKNVSEYKNKVRLEIRQKLDKYTVKYCNDESYYLISAEIDRLKINWENKILSIYFEEDYETSKDYFDGIIIKLYHQFEKELLNLLKKVITRNKKIKQLNEFALEDSEFKQFLDSSINYLYTNILNENFDEFYSKILNEINIMYRQLRIEKMNLNKIKNELVQNYVTSISRLDVLKDSKDIAILTDLYQQALKILVSFTYNNIPLDLIHEFSKIDFSDLNYTKKVINNIRFYSESNGCDVYIKRKKSNINGNAIKVRNIDEQVEYDYVIEKLNCSFSNTITLKEFKENYISLQQFLKQATFIGKYAKVTQYLIGNVKGIALYATANNALFLDLVQNKFKFAIIKDNISYFDDAEVIDDLKDKVEVYKMLMEQFSLAFDDNEFTQSKTKKIYN